MTSFERQVLLGVGAIVAVATSAAIALLGGGLLARILEPAFPVGPPGANVQGGELGTLYYVSFIVFSLAAGLLFFFLAWDQKGQSWRSNVLFGFGTLILLLISGFNFLSHDSLIPRTLQAGLNGVLIFVSAVVVLELWNVRLESMEARVCRAIVTTVLIALGIALPGTFTAIWLLARLGIDVSLTAQTISALAAVVGAITGVLTYLQKEKEGNS